MDIGKAIGASLTLLRLLSGGFASLSAGRRRDRNHPKEKEPPK